MKNEAEPFLDQQLYAKTTDLSRQTITCELTPLGANLKVIVKDSLDVRS